MEQPRLAATATRFYRALYLAHNKARQRGFAAASSGRSADPAAYSEDRDRELKPAVPSGKPEVSLSSFFSSLSLALNFKVRLRCSRFYYFV